MGKSPKVIEYWENRVETAPIWDQTGGAIGDEYVAPLAAAAGTMILKNDETNEPFFVCFIVLCIACISAALKSVPPIDEVQRVAISEAMALAEANPDKVLEYIGRDLTGDEVNTINNVIGGGGEPV